jgi:nicotinamide-nucleotide amidase
VIGEPRRAAVLAIGDELLGGRALDTNSGEIAARLLELGFEVERTLVVGDDARGIERAIAELCSAYPLVVATGGLGPTLDDVTRDAAAAAARVPLVRSDETLEELRALFRRRAKEMPRSNERQALFPSGAQLMPNRRGTAAGFRLWVEGGVLAVLPGPPHEMREMLERELLPWLAVTCGPGECFESRVYGLAGIAESAFADRAGDWMERAANPLMGVTAHCGVLRVSLRARAATREAARARLELRGAELRERFAEEVFSEDEPRLAHAVGAQLIQRGITLATAESCTGGLVASMLTEVPGISQVYLEGWVCYSDRAKELRLGVPRELIERHGAVSGEVASAMAACAARESGARAAVSVTGIAGPSGGTPEKPVGLVWFGTSVDGALRAFEERFPPHGRETVRLFAAHRALDLLRRHLPPT